jgi:Tetrapyrrole (Corrin/Porphyrin) Methylases
MNDISKEQSGQTPRTQPRKPLSIRRAAPTVGRRPGALVMIGSGIKAIGQFTLEAEAYLRWADAVYFCVADPATERWILEQKPNAVDLYTLYDNGKHRGHTYIQMTELMLRPLRRGLNVVGIFYGHPGVFVNPSHRAITLARQEGHEAVMLPAVSAMDCLFADIGIDPSKPGCQILEATDLLLRRRTLLTDAHLVVFQVGSVGDLGFKFAGFGNEQLSVLIRYLQGVYGDDYEIVHYIAAQYAVCEPVMDRVPLSRFHDPSMQKGVTGISTFYISPKVDRPADPEMAGALGLAVKRVSLDKKLTANALFSSAGYTRRELEVIAQLENHKVSPEYRPTRPSAMFYQLIKDLSLDPTRLEMFTSDADKALQYYPGVSNFERAAIVSRHYGRIRRAMQRSAAEVAQEFVKRILTDPNLANRYHALQSASLDQLGGRASVGAALRAIGYDTSPDDVTKAFEETLKGDVLAWSGDYVLVVDGRRLGPLRITSSGVWISDAPISNYRFDDSTLSWDDSANSNCGSLKFVLLTSKDGGALPEGSYIGPQFQGAIWAKGSERPTKDNAFGKVGVFTANDSDQFAADPIEAWVGTYQTNLLSSDGSWNSGPSILLRCLDSGADLLIDGNGVKRWAYANNYLSWLQAEPLYSGSVIFHRDRSNNGCAALVGRLWRGPEQACPGVNAVGEEVAT